MLKQAVEMWELRFFDDGSVENCIQRLLNLISNSPIFLEKSEAMTFGSKITIEFRKDGKEVAKNGFYTCTNNCSLRLDT